MYAIARVNPIKNGRHNEYVILCIKAKVNTSQSQNYDEAQVGPKSIQVEVRV